MAANIYFGSNASSAALMYEPISRDLGDWLSESSSRVLSQLSDRARDFFDRSSRYRERIGFDRAMAMRDQIKRTAQRLINDEDDLRFLTDLLDFQLAKPKMRRYLMADPEIRQMYREKRLSGWENAVEDDPTLPVNEVPEYQHLMQGVIVGEKYSYISNELLGLYEEHEPLTISDRADVMLSWDRMKAIIKYDKLDPTSAYGATLD